MKKHALDAFTSSVLKGQIRVSGAVRQVLSDTEALFAVQRHAVGDWGIVDEHSRRYNARALEDGAPVISAFQPSTCRKIWVITSSERDLTRVLFPEEDLRR